MPGSSSLIQTPAVMCIALTSTIPSAMPDVRPPPAATSSVIRTHSRRSRVSERLVDGVSWSCSKHAPLGDPLACMARSASPAARQLARIGSAVASRIVCGGAPPMSPQSFASLGASAPVVEALAARGITRAVRHPAPRDRGRPRRSRRAGASRRPARARRSPSPSRSRTAPRPGRPSRRPRPRPDARARHPDRRGVAQRDRAPAGCGSPPSTAASGSTSRPASRATPTSSWPRPAGSRTCSPAAR